MLCSLQHKQLALKWRRGCNLDFEISSQTAVLDGKVCVQTHVKNSSSVMVFDTQKEQWSKLCDRDEPIRDSAMVVNDSQLVLAGGVQGTHGFEEDKKTVAVWNVSSKKWQYPYPPMPTPRSSALSIRYQKYLIFVSGYQSTGQYYQNPAVRVVNVEILDTSRSQWYTAESLLEHSDLKQCVAIGDTLYLSESRPPFGHQIIFECSVPTLISLATCDSTATSESTATVPTWKKLPDTQLDFCSLMTYKNSLLAIGGLLSQKISGIYTYKLDTSEWLKIGDLPTALNITLFVVLPSNEFFVVSGKEVYIGTPDSV